MTSQKLRVDVTSDVICPFCLIGVKQLLQAAEKYRKNHPESPLELDVRMLPYQLNPALTDEPHPRSVYGAKKFGEERWKVISSQMVDKFKAVGLDANMDGTISSAHQAHRLQAYALAKYPSQQLPLAMSIFNGYHCDNHYPSDKDWLSTLAVQHGIFDSQEKAKAWLDSDAFDEEVKKGYKVAQKMGVTGVPFFVFQDKYAASGAMGVDEFVNIFEEIAKREQSESKLTQS